MVALLILAIGVPPVDDAAREEFLRYGEIVTVERVGQGASGSRRATLRLHGVSHDAHVQTVDVRHRPLVSLAHLEPGFTDSFKYNIAAYEIDRLLGVEMSPVCVFRRYQGQSAAFCWWVDDVLMSEAQRRALGEQAPDVTRHSRQVWRMRVFDQLIYNTDRNHGNLLYDKDWRLWAIDHTRAFREWLKLQRPDEISHIDRALLARLKAMDRKAVAARTREWLSPQQIDGLMARRNLIVDRIEERIRNLGEAQVLFDWPAESPRADLSKKPHWTPLTVSFWEEGR